MPWHSLLLAFAMAIILVGCGMESSDPEIAPEERLGSQAAYESLLVATPDTVLATMQPLDSFFLDHDLLTLAPPPYDSVDAMRWVDSLMAALSLDQKIGQLFIVHLPRPGLRQLLNDEAVDAVETYGVGGFLVPRLLGPREVFNATQRLQHLTNVPLFFAADYERGVGRFNNAFTELPSNMALGATRDTLLAAAAGRLSALESRAIGVNLLLAPVVDVNDNPDNPIINIRSYGEDPELVARMAAAFVHEAQRYGVLTTLKHFPGHGNTSVDSHAHMGVVEGDMAALDSVELYPYGRVLRGPSPPAGVMSAHLWVPAFNDEPLPATFSPNVLTHLLRDSLGFDGFIVTDDIKMGALQNTYAPATRITRSLQAGADIILTPARLPRAIQNVKAALREGTLMEASINQSVRRILTAKARAGLYRERHAESAALDTLLSKPRGAYLAQIIADRALTLLKTDPVLPLTAGHRVVTVQLANTESSESIDAAMAFLADTLQAAHNLRIGTRPPERTINTVLEAARAADVVVLALYLRLQAGRGEAGLFDPQEDLVERLLDLDTPVVLVTFGNPYAVIPFARAEVLLVAYDQSLESAAAAAGILLGQQPPRGILPITVEPYAFGDGLGL